MPKDKDEKKKLVIVEEVTPDETPQETVEEKVEVKTDNEIIEETKEEKEEKAVREEKTVEDKAREVASQKRKEEELEPLDYQEKSSGLMWIIVLTALLVGALAGGFITYFSGLSRLQNPLPTATPMVTQQPQATTTPAPADTTLKREDLKVQVLNGSGVSGAAGKAKAALEKLGYKDVQTGNAPTSDVAETEISILKAKESYLDMLKKDLEGSYTVSATTKTLPTSSKFDVVITLGKK